MGVGRIVSLCHAFTKQLNNAGDIGLRFGRYFGDLVDIAACLKVLVEPKPSYTQPADNVVHALVAPPPPCGVQRPLRNGRGGVDDEPLLHGECVGLQEMIRSRPQE